MFGPNLSGEEPHWSIGLLFAVALLAFPVAVAVIAVAFI